MGLKDSFGVRVAIGRQTIQASSPGTAEVTAEHGYSHFIRPGVTRWSSLEKDRGRNSERELPKKNHLSRHLAQVGGSLHCRQGSAALWLWALDKAGERPTDRQD